MVAPLLIAATPHPAYGSPLLEAEKHVGNDPQWDTAAQPGSEIEFDQRIAWQVWGGSCPMPGESPAARLRATAGATMSKSSWRTLNSFRCEISD
jgi:hypothetical protein